jgi:aerobic carbon-monoxide dehydrogenase large subunit
MRLPNKMPKVSAEGRPPKSTPKTGIQDEPRSSADAKKGMKAMGFIGRSVPRLEDPPLVSGRGAFAADISFAHQLHMRVVRSAHAHGRLAALDIKAARAARGVLAVWTAADVAAIPPIDFRLTRIAGLEAYRQPILATDRVRYVGEPVAVVFAENPYLAEDAADLVAVEVEELPALLAAEAPPGEFGGGHSTEAACIGKEFGDVDAAFASAHSIVSLELAVGRHSGVPLETRGAVAREHRGILELHGAAKVLHWNRDTLARMLSRAPSSVHLHEGHVGGGFGVRGEIYPEDVLVCLAALRLSRPIKWIEDRREHLMAANHSRQQLFRVRAAVDAQGRLLAIDGEFFHDQGAYVRTHAATVPDLAAAMLPGPYRLGAYRMVGRIRLTNKTPGGTYRAPGRYESTFVRERLMDAIAARLKTDPIEIRRRNLIAKSEMPYTLGFEALGTDVTYDSGDYAGLLDKTLAAADWPALQQRLRRRRAGGEAVGAGLAMFVEKSGLGPFDGVRMTIDDDGAVEIVSGSASVGQGMETAIAQICADTLGVDYRAVRVVHGQTDRIAFGMGAFASRVTVLTGEATRRAATKLRARAIAAASLLLQSAPETLDVVDGKVVSGKSAHGPSISLGEVARALAPGRHAVLADASGKADPQSDTSPGLSAEAWIEQSHMAYPYGVHIAVVRVDRDTGGVAVERYLVGYDIGRAVNPMLVEGQIAGGMAQGIGGALFEEFLYDAGGEPLCVNFADYLMPTAREIPPIEVLVTEDAPSPLNALGLKGAGEGGANPVGAVVAAAIDDALRIPGAVTRLPVSPQRLRAIVRRHGAV